MKKWPQTETGSQTGAFTLLAELLIVGAGIEDSEKNTAQTRKATR